MSPTVFITADAVGGVWQYSLDLAAGLAERGVDPVVAVSGPSPAAEQKRKAHSISGLHLIDTGLPLDWTAESPEDVAGAAKSLAALAANHKADLIHLNSPALAACTNFGVPVVAVQHSCLSTWWSAVRGGPTTPDLAWRAALTSQGLRKADAIIAPTAAFAAASHRAHELSTLPHVVFNGRRTATARAEVGEPIGAFTAGRLWDDGKNIAALNEAARLLAFPIWAAGSRKNPNGGEAHFDCLICLGSIAEEEVAAILAQRPIYVSAAIYEPFGLAVLEAAQAGCALILSDIPTFRELWDEVALFVQPHDPEAFAVALAEVAADPHLRHALGERARVRAALYSLDAMVNGICAIHKEVLSARNSNRGERAA